MKNLCIREPVLWAFLDNELPDSQALDVHRHLGTCSDCLKKLQDMKETYDLLENFPEVEPSSAFDRTFWQKIADEGAHQKARNWKGFFPFSWRPVLTAGLAASMAVGLFFGIFQYRSHQSFSQEDIFMAENIELLSDYDLIRHLDLLEYWETIDGIEDHT